MRNSCIFLLILLSACNQHIEKQAPGSIISNEIKYAKGFAIFKQANSYRVDVYNPWRDYEILASYLLTDSGKFETTNGVVSVKIPVKSGAFLSSTYLGMLSALNNTGVISSCVSANWAYDSIIYRKFRNGQIINLGNDLTINPEAIIASSPEMVMKYIYQTPDATDEILKSAGIPVVYNIEFMETHPLGRAEWIKLVGLLTGKKDEADSVFKEIEKRYNSLCSLAISAQSKPSVMVGNTYKGSWYAVGGNSYIARLISDANATYYWSADSSTGSLPLSFEAVLQKQKDDEFWLSANAASLAEISGIEPRCKELKAFQTGNVYHYNKRVNPEGGLDYYESGVIRPDLLLHDILLILHPELFDNTEETIYWQKLK